MCTECKPKGFFSRHAQAQENVNYFAVQSDAGNHSVMFFIYEKLGYCPTHILSKGCCWSRRMIAQKTLYAKNGIYVYGIYLHMHIQINIINVYVILD